MFLRGFTMAEIEEEQHQDFIWTWKSNGRGNKVSVWLPYFSEVSKNNNTWCVKYNGGSLNLDLNKIDLIMFYGASGNLPLNFLDDVAKHNIVLMIHKRNVTRPYVFYTSNIGDSLDVLSRQITYRNNEIKKAYIARILIKERFSKMKEVYKVPEDLIYRLTKARNVKKIRETEAITTKFYWTEWFKSIELDESRRSDNSVSAALDAGSKFVSGVLLRWILFHKLSPCHGYLHEPTNYPSLVYDLMEPYRYIIEQAVCQSVKKCGFSDEKKLVATTLEKLKFLLEVTVYVPATRQYIRRKNLLHGIVLALRSYLLGESKCFIIPTEGEKKGGRPPQIAYKLPGSRNVGGRT